MPEIRFPIGLPPTETLEFFRAKGSYRLIDRWWEMWEEEHVRAFTVTGITNTSLLESVRASLDKVLDGGGTFEMWKKSILPDLKTAVAAGTAPINILTDRRLRTIYETNIRMARAAGKWKRIQVTKARRPYLMYVALDDGRTRPLHALWGGLTTGKPIIAPVDHIIWTILFPPNGWGCRCSVIQLSERSLVERNLQLTTDAELIGMKLIKADGSLDGDPFDYVRGDGAIISVPRGIDPGFAYNVGEAHLRGLVPVPRSGEILETQIVGKVPPEFPRLPVPRQPDDEMTLPVDVLDEIASNAFLDSFGVKGEEAVLFTDVLGHPVIIDRSFVGKTGKLARGRFAKLAALTLREPDEIWSSWNSPPAGTKGPGDKPVKPSLRRIYLANFLIEGRSQPIAVIVEIGPDGWTGKTWFPPKEGKSVAAVEAYLNNSLRGGQLEYRRATNEDDTR